jgi:hypothetical protein
MVKHAIYYGRFSIAQPPRYRRCRLNLRGARAQLAPTTLAAAGAGLFSGVVGLARPLHM